MVVSGLVENHTPNALTLSFTHLKSFSGARFVSFPVLAPIHKATVFYVTDFGESKLSGDMTIIFGRRTPVGLVSGDSTVIRWGLVWGSTFFIVPTQDLLKSPFNSTHEPSLNYRKHN